MFAACDGPIPHYPFVLRSVGVPVGLCRPSGQGSRATCGRAQVAAATCAVAAAAGANAKRVARARSFDRLRVAQSGRSRAWRSAAVQLQAAGDDNSNDNELAQGDAAPWRCATPPATTRVFGISDLHTDWEQNLARLEALPLGPFCHDAILVAGDVSHRKNIFVRTMEVLLERFGHVFFVPGNHDVYVGGTSVTEDSLEKHQWLMDECSRLGVWTSPARFPNERLILVPLLSWYHSEFDSEPDVPTPARPDAASRRHRRLALLGDEIGCSWPDSLGATPSARNLALAELFDAANEDVRSLRASGGAAAVEPVTFQEALAARQQGEAVISMSHFLPRSGLLPEKRFLFFPQLARAAGSLLLGERLARLRPSLHFFGHTHFAWDQTDASDGVRFVQAPLGSPAEWVSRPRSMRLGVGGLPTLLWRGRQACEPLPAPRSALWSDYYAQNAREPDSEQVGAWIRFRAQSRRKASDKTSDKTHLGSKATLWIVWDVDCEPGAEQWAVLNQSEQLRARSFTSEGSRRRFVWMRAALRSILAETLGQQPELLTFEYGPCGKPKLATPDAARRCSFSISHSGSLGAVLLYVPGNTHHNNNNNNSNNQNKNNSHSFGPAEPVGVDLEEHRPRPFQRLARRFFLPQEAEELDSPQQQQPPQQQQRQQQEQQQQKQQQQEHEGESAISQKFFEMWTKKEAWLKALGTGLSGGIGSLDCSTAGDVRVDFKVGGRDGSTPYVVSSLQDLPLGMCSVAVALPEGSSLHYESLSQVGWSHFCRRRIQGKSAV
ncbi:unnamed protein product [Polarella glacialis]|uniref:4'-phosphopantetheinyl transferase domain-containing protein n=1 Tax=Polarella glacialis TaxID=89957 RepID=A0A813F2Q3_POLGL|nr:unnamed protein product [Polarella glacialis]